MRLLEQNDFKDEVSQLSAVIKTLHYIEIFYSGQMPNMMLNINIMYEANIM